MEFSRQIVSVIAASVLTAHVIVGCCAHHMHRKLTAGDSAFAAKCCDHGHHSHHDCDHRSADSATPTDDSGPCDHSCDHGSCSFLAGSKIVLPDLAQPAGTVAAEFVSFACQPDSSCDAMDQLPHGAIIPPLRSHLSKCVLLV